jgi:hypothetical protein
LTCMCSCLTGPETRRRTRCDRSPVSRPWI